MATPQLYGLFLKSLVEGRIDFANHAFKGMLCSSLYVPNYNSHQFKNSVNNEVIGSGYIQGGQDLTIGTITYSQKVLTIQAGNMNWPLVTFTDAKYLVVYDDSYTSDATRPLILYVDFGTPQASAAQSFYYNWPSNQLLQVAIP